jgi:hypothetical protein
MRHAKRMFVRSGEHYHSFLSALILPEDGYIKSKQVGEYTRTMKCYNVYLLPNVTLIEIKYKILCLFHGIVIVSNV